MGDARFEAQLRACLGSAQARISMHAQARQCLQRARALLAPTTDKLSTGLVLCGIAENEYLDDRRDDAQTAATEAREIWADLGSDEASELGRRLAQVSELMRG